MVLKGRMSSERMLVIWHVRSRQMTLAILLAGGHSSEAITSCFKNTNAPTLAELGRLQVRGLVSAINIFQ